LRKKHNKRVIIAVRGMLSEGSINVKRTKKKIFLRSVKMLKLFDNVMFHATSELEKKEINKIFGDVLPIKVAANLSQKISTRIFSERIKQVGSLKLVNIARIAPEKNLLYALEVLKLVKGNVLFDIYGPIYNEEYWNKCREITNELPDNIKVEYKGIIEQNRVLEVFNDYHFMFMPSTGENFGHVILQSFTAGCPVIISDHTPWKDLKEKNIGWDLALLHPSLFAQVIDESVLMGQSRYNKLSKASYYNAVEYSSNHLLVEQNRHLFI
jgi:glycosyltransferase involved in cell wall biosynthesis